MNWSQVLDATEGMRRVADGERDPIEVELMAEHRCRWCGGQFDECLSFHDLFGPRRTYWHCGRCSRLQEV